MRTLNLNQSTTKGEILFTLSHHAGTQREKEGLDDLCLVSWLLGETVRRSDASLLGSRRRAETSSGSLWTPLLVVF